MRLIRFLANILRTASCDEACVNGKIPNNLCLDSIRRDKANPIGMVLIQMWIISSNIMGKSAKKFKGKKRRVDMVIGGTIKPPRPINTFIGTDRESNNIERLKPLETIPQVDWTTVGWCTGMCENASVGEVAEQFSYGRKTAILSSEAMNRIFVWHRNRRRERIKSHEGVNVLSFPLGDRRNGFYLKRIAGDDKPRVRSAVKEIENRVKRNH